jgi:peptidoglycan/xylan/chitin deacetylase (PgdA/CDA1 family)
MAEVAYRTAIAAMGVVAGIASLYRPAVLCFHSVVPADRPDLFSSAMAVTDTFLDHLIRDLRRHAIPIVSLDEAMARLGDGRFDPFVCLTFDDGYRDNYDHAFPVLRRHGAPFTIFLATGLVDRETPMWWHALEQAIATSDRIAWAGGSAETLTARGKASAFATLRERFRASDPDGVRRFARELADRNTAFDAREAYTQAVTWDMVRAMLAHDIASFGCHTVSHPLLSRAPRPWLEAEIAGSRDRLRAETGLAPRYFAYPYGQPEEVGALAPSVVADAGFVAAFTTKTHVLSAKTTRSLFKLPRIMITRKAQAGAVVRGYLSGLPSALKRDRWVFQGSGRNA